MASPSMNLNNLIYVRRQSIMHVNLISCIALLRIKTVFPLIFTKMKNAMKWRSLRDVAVFIFKLAVQSNIFCIVSNNKNTYYVYYRPRLSIKKSDRFETKSLEQSKTVINLN